MVDQALRAPRRAIVAELVESIDVRRAQISTAIGLLAGEEERPGARRDRGDDRARGLDVDEARLRREVCVRPVGEVLLFAPGEAPKRAAVAWRAVEIRAENLHKPFAGDDETATVRNRRTGERRDHSRQRAWRRGGIPLEEPPIGRRHRQKDRAEIVETVGVWKAIDRHVGADRPRRAVRALVVVAVAVAALRRRLRRFDPVHRRDVEKRPASVDIEVRFAQIRDVINLP